MFEYKFEGIEIFINISNHAKDRLAERGVILAPVYGCVVGATDKVLDLKSGEEFAIVDRDLNIAVVGVVRCAVDITVDIITVIDSDKIWVKAGTKVIALEI